MKRSDDKLANVLKEYAKEAYDNTPKKPITEAVGEAPSGELHPDLDGDQADYEMDEETAAADRFLEGLMKEVVQLIREKVEAYRQGSGSALEADAGLDMAIEFNSDASNGLPVEEYAFAEFMYQALNNTKLIGDKAVPEKQETEPAEAGE